MRLLFDIDGQGMWLELARQLTTMHLFVDLEFFGLQM